MCSDRSPVDTDRTATDQSAGLAFVGFGEAAQAFVEGWGAARAARTRAYDIKTDHRDAATREAKWADYARVGVSGCTTPAEALNDVGTVFSTVTADQALRAAEEAAIHIAKGALYFDCNSCSPETKRKAALAIDAAGGCYVDSAVMTPVHPKLHRTPLLLSGPHAEAAAAVAEALDMNARAIEGAVGKASSIKMLRSVMVKGLEALLIECVLAGRQAGVDEVVLDSLEASFPGFDFQSKTAAAIGRVTKHGARRAAEMREVAQTLDELGISPHMANATAAWQQKIGALGQVAGDDYKVLADTLLARLFTEEDTA